MNAYPELLRPYAKAHIRFNTTIMLVLLCIGLITDSSSVFSAENTMARQNTKSTSSTTDQLLIKAESMIIIGNPAAAYALLEPFEFELAGEERFDYLLGIAALDSGMPDKATFALERVLQVNPNSTAARLDMARAYFQLGDFPRAKFEFNIVLQQKPSEAALDNIKKYLEKIHTLETGNNSSITGYIEGTVGSDSNVNNSTSQTRIYVDTLAANATLDPTNIRTSDTYIAAAAGAEITYRLNSFWHVYAAADARKRRYTTQQSFDALNLDARAGIARNGDTNQVRLGLMNGQYILGTAHNSDASGINTEWRHILSPANQLKLFGQFSQYRFVDTVMKQNDFDQQSIGGGWQHVLSNGKSSLFCNLYQGTEKDVSTIITLPASPNGGRTDGARNFSGIRFGGHMAVSNKSILFVNAGIQQGHYEKTNYWFQRKRVDQLTDLNMGINWQINKDWTARPQLIYAMNDSNIEIYAFNRTDISLSIHRDFR